MIDPREPRTGSNPAKAQPTATNDTLAPPSPPAPSREVTPHAPLVSFVDSRITVDRTTTAAPAATLHAPISGYEIMGELGRGGMGVVYLARQVRLNRLVALKMILAGAHAGSAELERFHAEAEAIARLQHPGIVQVYEIGQHDGTPYFSLEYCPGGSLATKLRGTPLPPQDAALLVEKLGHAVQAAHYAGIVHRDLKPANVLLSFSRDSERSARHGALPSEPPLNDAIPKISDFGLAKKIDQAGNTASGAVMGTPSYMAPEQAGGHSKDSGPTADVYALGAILYELLTGRPPFKAATTLDTIVQVLTVEPVPPTYLQPKTPRDLETICLKCLQKQPLKRYASAAALAGDLRAFLEHRPIQARPTSRAERLVKWVRRRPAAAALIAVSVLAAAALAVAATWFTLQLKDERDTARSAIAQRDLADQDRARAEQRRLLGQVEQLRTADAAAVPTILANLAGVRGELLPHLRDLWSEAPGAPNRLGGRHQQMRVGLALLPAEPDRVKAHLVAWMLDADDPREVEVVRDQLVPWADELKTDLWRTVSAAGTSPPQRLRALVALARFDADDPRWAKATAEALPPWLQANPLHLGVWTRALQPARRHFLAPLTEVFRGNAPHLAERRYEAAAILAIYAEDDPARLADLVAGADVRQLPTILASLRSHGDRARLLLERELDRLPPGPALGELERVARAKRQANAATALLLLNQPGRVWRWFRHSSDPTARSYLVHRVGPLGVPARLLVERLETEKDVSARQALILCLGEFSTVGMPVDLRQRLTPHLLSWYRDDPDPGIHAAIGWLLRHGKDGPELRKLDWGQAVALRRIDVDMKGKQPPAGAGRRWFVNRQGQTEVLIPGPVVFDMGSPRGETGRTPDERRHKRRIGRSFALTATPVTVAQYQTFVKDHPEVKQIYPRQFSPEPDGPIIAVTFHEAAQYCRWLSEKEGVPEKEMVYPSFNEIEKCKDNITPLRLPANYLSRTGYRLPTEAEWEFACRAEAATSHYYGSGEELLAQYGWYLKNSSDRTWPVGQKKPNDFGFLDMHGAVWTWCQDSALQYPPELGGKPVEDVEDRRDIIDRVSRILRGGGYGGAPAVVRSAYRLANRPSLQGHTVGLRVARTVRTASKRGD